MDVLRSISPSRTSVDATAGSIPADRGSVAHGASFRTHSDGTLSTTDYTASLERSTSIAPVKTHLDGLKHGEESPFHNPFNVLGREESSGIPSSSSSCSNGQLFPYDHSSTRSMFLSDPNTSPSAGEGMSDDREEGLISPPLSVPLAEDSGLPTTLQTGISPLFASAVNISAQLQSHGHLSGTESVALQSRDQSVGSIRDQSRLPTPLPLPSSHAHSTSFISHGSLALHNSSPSHHILQQQQQQQQRHSISPQKIGHLTSTTLLADGLSALQNQQQQLTVKEHTRHSPKSVLSPSAIAIASQDAPRSPRRLAVSADLPTLLSQPHISPKAISPVVSARAAAIPLMPTAVVAPAIPAGVAASAFAFNFAANNTATRLLRPPGALPLRSPLHYPLPIGFEEEGGLFVPGRKRKNWRRTQLDTADGARRSLQPHYRYRVKLNHGLEQLRMMTCPTFNDATHYDILTCAIARIHELEEEIRLLEYHEDIARRRREKRMSLLATPKRRKTQFTFEGTTARDEEGNVIEGSVHTPDTEDASQPREKKAEEQQQQQQQADDPLTAHSIKKEPTAAPLSPPSVQTTDQSAEGSDSRTQSIAQPKAASSGTDSSSPIPITTPNPTPLPSEAASFAAEGPTSPPVPASSSASTDTDKEGNRMCVSVSVSPSPPNEAQSHGEGMTVSVPSASSASPRPLSAAASATDQQAPSSSDLSSLKGEQGNAEPELPPSTSELHSLLFHSACLPRFILSTDFEFIAVNRAYAALFLAPIDLRGISFLSIVQSELVQPASLTLSSVLDSPDDVMQIEGLKIVDEGAVYSCELIIWCARETKEDGARVATCIQGVELSRQPLIMARP